jgi:hypothetical protein
VSKQVRATGSGGESAANVGVRASGAPVRAVVNGAKGASAHGENCSCTRCVGFVEGHRLSERHGMFVRVFRPAEVAEIEEIAEALRDACPLYHAGFEAKVQQTAARIWRWRRGYADLVENGFFRGKQREPAPILRRLDTLERTIQRDLHELALTPMAQAELGLVAARARGEALRQHLAARYGGERDDGPER